MRATLVGMVCVVGVATAQPPAPVAKDEARYGVAYRGRAFPQETPADALRSVIAAAEEGRLDYLAAHLLDPAFVDVRVADRARLYEPAAEAELVRRRDEQRLNADRVPAADRLPDDPTVFKGLAARQGVGRAFGQLVADVRVKLADDPQAIKDLRRFLRDGTFADGGETSKLTLPDVKDRAVFFKKVGERWFVENRQADDTPKPAAP